MGYELHTTKHFDKWFGKLRDKSTKRKVLARLDRVENGSLGDHKKINPDLFELRFFFGGGLRIYYTIRKKKIILLLIGGNKSSQQNDIQKVQGILSEME
jgi:putative addiction module killer protein